MAEFFDNLMVELVSQKTTEHLVHWASFFKIIRIHAPWHAQEAAAKNSASVVESINNDCCFFEDQALSPKLSKNMYTKYQCTFMILNVSFIVGISQLFAPFVKYPQVSSTFKATENPFYCLLMSLVVSP